MSGGLSAREAREFGRKLARLNKGEHKVIDLAKAAAREVPLKSVEGQLLTAGMPRGRDELRELSSAEYVVWAMATLSCHGLRKLSLRELGRVMKVSEARVRQLREAALRKMERGE